MSLPTPPPIDAMQFRLISDYIERYCGIHMTEEKVYLIQSRLAPLLGEYQIKSYHELVNRAGADQTLALRDKIIDAMTTHETLWFRDTQPFEVLDRLFETFMKNQGGSPLRIWSAACATGQEPYSIAMSVLEYARRNPLFNPRTVSIVASDISRTVLYQAKAGRYDGLAMSRGLPLLLRERYFSPQGKHWELSAQVKSMVTFKRVNLQDDFSTLGPQDIVFCRNILIYFSDPFKRDVLCRIARMLRPAGILFVGSSESIINYSDEFTMHRNGSSLYYAVRP